MIVVWLFLALPWVGLQFVIVVFPDQTHLLLFSTEEGRCIIIYVKTDINATKLKLLDFQHYRNYWNKDEIKEQ